MIYSVSNTKYNHSINTAFTPLVFHKPPVVQTCMMSNVCTVCQDGDETMSVDTVSMVRLEIEHGVELIMTLMLSVLYMNMRRKLKLHLKQHETRM